MLHLVQFPNFLFYIKEMWLFIIILCHTVRRFKRELRLGHPQIIFSRVFLSLSPLGLLRHDPSRGREVNVEGPLEGGLEK